MFSRSNFVTVLGRPALSPLQWLKMEGMLCRWALAMQEYDFTIVQRLSECQCKCPVTSRHWAQGEWWPLIKSSHKCLLKHSNHQASCIVVSNPTNCQHVAATPATAISPIVVTLFKDGAVYRKYRPGPTNEIINCSDSSCSPLQVCTSAES